MSIEKENFLRTRLVRYLQQLDPATPPRWGQMSVQHMIEHLGHDAFRLANGHFKTDKLFTPVEQIPRMQEFLLTDKPLRQNVKNPLLGEFPPPLRYRTTQAAINALQEEMIYFFEVFEKDPLMKIRNPFFGDLGFEQQVQVLYKHALHHLRQFGVVPVESH